MKCGTLFMTNTLMYDLFNEIFKTGNWGVTTGSLSITAWFSTDKNANKENINTPSCSNRFISLVDKNSAPL